MRLRTWAEPPETDLATYWLVARELLHGKRLYSEVWDIKPPAVYWTYAAGAWLSDNPFLARYLLWCVASTLALLGIFQLTRKLYRSESGGILAAALWTLVAADCWLQANQPNAEVFMNVCAVWGLAALVNCQSNAGSNRWAFLGGILLALGSLYKTVMMAHIVVFWIVLVLSRLRRASSQKVSALNLIGSFTAGAALPWVLFLVNAVWQGTLADAYATLFYWGRAYTHNPLSNIFAALVPSRVVPHAANNVLPAIVLALVGIFHLLQTPRRQGTEWLAGWTAATFLAYSLPGRFYPHYYQLWLPLLCVLASATVLGIRRLSATRDRLRLRLLVGGLVLTQALVQLPFYLRSAETWSLAKYGPAFIEQYRQGRELQRYLAPDETLYVWGTAPTLYEAANRRPASGIFFVIPLLWGPTTETLTRRALQDLRRTQPELIAIDRKDVPSPPAHPIVQWFYANYVAHPDLPPLGDRFRLYCRKHGNLQSRLANKLWNAAP
jgi:4-amino-4-deoxy-L-arabinose transferase-like glycosyltransferase